jgi:methylenetetrahydrofolate reductase (NADPH)
MDFKSNLHKVLIKQKFAVTAEVGPPKSSNADVIKNKGLILKGYADAFNVTDNQTAVVRMSSLAGSFILNQMNLEPILQISCRDRNRIALQSDILGASALGIKNILFITGDHQSKGNHPTAKGVFDIDSVQLIKIVNAMSNKGVFQNGEKISSDLPKIFIGAVCNPFASPYDFRMLRLEKKIKAGAEFIQTQSVFNIERFADFMDEICDNGLDKKVFILAGITPLKSEKMLNRMKHFVPGVDIPDDVEKRLLSSNDFKEESINYSIDMINQLKKIKGITGIHITALFWEDIIPKIIKECNLHPRPF